MYIVTNRIEVPAERAAAFEERFIGNMRTNLPKVQGLARATLDRPVDPAARYKVTMEFESESAFETWHDSEAFRASHAKPAAGNPSAPSAQTPGSEAKASGPEHHIRIETFVGGRE
ncbi:antibiotic biosynthesis monooxygenase family protein [Paeniglutamicibacter antarcticus]|uniref:ABM domain-containing protein n=1 Tax=Paeniglutamicibacter antarcticus TaxID=494023 RepID=A0ABP9TP97_9MICC